jgi:hypothetical protein
LGHIVFVRLSTHIENKKQGGEETRESRRREEKGGERMGNVKCS